MRIVVWLLLAVLLSGCGRDTTTLTGPAGPMGPKGDDGIGCSAVIVLPGGFAPYGGSIVTCGHSSVLIANGSPGADGPDGADGHDGEDGEDGHDGADGHNGADGHDGADAPPTAFTIVGMVDPCGTQGLWDEVFLLLANGKVIASLSDNSSGKNTRLWEVRDGVGLATTDNTGCTFSLQTVGHTRTISWSGGSQSWTVP